MDLWVRRDASSGVAADNWGKWLEGEFTGKMEVQVHIPAHGAVVHRWYVRGNMEEGRGSVETGGQELLRGEL